MKNSVKKISKLTGLISHLCLNSIQERQSNGDFQKKITAQNTYTVLKKVTKTSKSTLITNNFKHSSQRTRC